MQIDTSDQRTMMELDTIHTYFRAELQEPWKVVKDCGAHLQPVLIADARRRWDETQTPDLVYLRRGLLLALVSITRKSYVSAESTRTEALAVSSIVGKAACEIVNKAWDKIITCYIIK